MTIPTILHSHACSVPTLNGSNFSEWHEKVQFILGMLDFDLALLVEKPIDITIESTVTQVNSMKDWERSN